MIPCSIALAILSSFWQASSSNATRKGGEALKRLLNTKPFPIHYKVDGSVYGKYSHSCGLLKNFILYPSHLLLSLDN